MLEFSNIEQRKARKNHKCEMCGKPIYKGCEYIYESQKYDGKIHTYKRHIHCDAMLDACLTSIYPDIGEYDIDSVTDSIWNEVCCSVCGDEQRDECGEDWKCLYACEICQKKLLPPAMLGAAIQSVRDNTMREDND